MFSMHFIWFSKIRFKKQFFYIFEILTKNKLIMKIAILIVRILFGAFMVFASVAYLFNLVKKFRDLNYKFRYYILIQLNLKYSIKIQKTFLFGH